MTSSDHAPGQARDDRIVQMVRHWSPPPRGQLPPDVHVEWLPSLGRAWYSRGIDYWLRRVLNVILVAVAVLIQFFLISVIGKGIRDASTTGFYVSLFIWLVCSIVAFVYYMRGYLRRRRNIKLLRKVPQRPKWSLGRGRSGRPHGGAGVSVPVYAGSEIGIFLWTLAALVTLGPSVAVLLINLEPVLPEEWRARYDVAEDLEHAAYMDERGTKVRRRWRQHRRRTQGMIERGELDKPFRS